MLRKLYKKLTVVAIVCIISICTTTVMATEITNDVQVPNTTITGDIDNNVLNPAATRGSNSVTIELKHTSSSTVKLVNMGFNPKVTITATGNPKMTYKIWVVNPVGIEGVVGYVKGDGSSITKRLTLSIGGDYYVYVANYEGSTNGKSAYFDIDVTW